MNKRGYCISIDTLFQGPVPAVTEILPNEPANANGRICIFPTELEAQREIADSMMIRLQQFLDGERDFNDAIAVEEYVVEVEVFPDGAMLVAVGDKFDQFD